MAIIKATKGGSSLGKAMDYVEKKAELTSGKDCPDDKEKALEQMQTTKEIYDQTEGRQYKHYVQSFEPGETNPQQAHEIGKEWAEKNFEGHEVYIATHTDKDHIHNHFIVNSVNHENGKKIHTSNQDLENFKKENDRICEREGLSIPERKQGQELRSYDMEKYQQIQKAVEGKGNSYILDTALTVDKVATTSQSKEEFIRGMKSEGYKTEWHDHKKHITFTDKNGKKVRAANLVKTFNDPSFGKEGLEQSFSRNRKLEKAIEPQEQSREQPKSLKEIQNEIADLKRNDFYKPEQSRERVQKQKAQEIKVEKSRGYGIGD